VAEGKNPSAAQVKSLPFNTAIPNNHKQKNILVSLTAFYGAYNCLTQQKLPCNSLKKKSTQIIENFIA